MQPRLDAFNAAGDRDAWPFLSLQQIADLQAEGLLLDAV